MNIVSGTPPNYADIINVFPDAVRSGVIFTYGDTVYVKGKPELPEQLKVHEGVHVQQQKAVGVQPWWDRYLVDRAFRFEQELVAHRAEYRRLRSIDPNLGRRHLDFIAKRLSSPLYGGVCTFREARKAIRA